VVTDLVDLMTARTLRDDGLALVEASQSPEWTTAACRCIDELAASGEPFSADDVRAIVGTPLHPRAFGMVFKWAVESDALERVGMVQSKRPEARGRWIVIYRGCS
jgi:hypothetical protein